MSGDYWWMPVDNAQFRSMRITGDAFVLYRERDGEQPVKACFDHETGGLVLLMAYYGINKVLSNDYSEFERWKNSISKAARFVDHTRLIKNTLIDILARNDLEYELLELATPVRKSKTYCDLFYQSMKDLMDVRFRLA